MKPVRHDRLDVTMPFARARLREVLTVPVDLAFRDSFDFRVAHGDRIGLDAIARIGQLTEHAGRFLKDAHHPAVLDPAGAIANGIS